MKTKLLLAALALAGALSAFEAPGPGFHFIRRSLPTKVRVLQVTRFFPVRSSSELPSGGFFCCAPVWADDTARPIMAPGNIMRNIPTFFMEPPPKQPELAAISLRTAQCVLHGGRTECYQAIKGKSSLGRFLSISLSELLSGGPGEDHLRLVETLSGIGEVGVKRQRAFKMWHGFGNLSVGRQCPAKIVVSGRVLGIDLQRKPEITNGLFRPAQLRKRYSQPDECSCIARLDCEAPAVSVLTPSRSGPAR